MRYSDIIENDNRRGQHLAEGFGGVIDFDPRVDSRLFDLDCAASNGTITKKQVREFGSYLNGHKNDFIRMYHGTSAAHDVMGAGLLPTSRTRARSLQSASGFVYVTYDPQRAITFANMAYAGEYKDVIVYSVDVTIGRLLPDHDQLRNKRMWSGIDDIGSTLAHSLIYGAGARIKGRIEPFQITEFGRFDKHGEPIPDKDGN